MYVRVTPCKKEMKAIKPLKMPFIKKEWSHKHVFCNLLILLKIDLASPFKVAA